MQCGDFLLVFVHCDVTPSFCKCAEMEIFEIHSEGYFLKPVLLQNLLLGV